LFAIFGTFGTYVTNIKGTFVENVKKVQNQPTLLYNIFQPAALPGNKVFYQKEKFHSNQMP
jgi:hypothetical protein